MFKVYLPASLSGEIKKTSSGQDEIFQGHGELILLVEDEAAVREISKLALEANGYRVITANDGTEAVALFAQEKEHIKLVITDMNMPFMDGPALIRALQRMNPNVLIIGASGLADKEKIEEVKAAGIQSFLSKPYTAEKLTKTIADMLRRS
jgi:CheY-like chemotaxis protein